jgi:hypothetical protein
MLAPAALLALCCAFIGLFPGTFARPLNGAISVFTSAAMPRIETLAPLAPITPFAAVLLLLALAFALQLRRRTGPVRFSRTWGCGYLAPSPRMQYSASSFADTIVGWFAPVLRPRVHRAEVDGNFPRPTSYESHVPETALECGYLPFLEYLYEKSAPLRRLQHGKLNIYIFYTFLTLVVLMALTVYR